MDKVSSSVKAVHDDSLSFFKYVFNFDDDNKSNLLNMVQYAILSIIPVLLILKATKHFVPAEDETKGSLEISIECIGQILLIILAIWFTNKIIRYIPTYSGEYYGKFNETNFIIPFIIILATMQTKLGAKLNILIDRVIDLWHGKKEPMQQQGQGQQGQGQGQNVVRVSQPFAGGGQRPVTQADYLDRSQLLPSNPQLSAMPNQQQNPDFNSMYPNNPTPMPGAMQPGMMMEPVAANEGGGWGSVW